MSVGTWNFNTFHNMFLKNLKKLVDETFDLNISVFLFYVDQFPNRVDHYIIIISKFNIPAKKLKHRYSKYSCGRIYNNLRLWKNIS